MNQLSFLCGVDPDSFPKDSPANRELARSLVSDGTVKRDQMIVFGLVRTFPGKTSDEIDELAVRLYGCEVGESVAILADLKAADVVDCGSLVGELVDVWWFKN